MQHRVCEKISSSCTRSVLEKQGFTDVSLTHVPFHHDSVRYCKASSKQLLWIEVTNEIKMKWQPRTNNGEKSRGRNQVRKPLEHLELLYKY